MHERVYDTFAAALAARMDALVQGPGVVAGVTLGPLINAAAADKCARHVADAVAKGAVVARGGSLHETLGRSFFQPTLLLDVSPDAAPCCEETFGPVAALVRVRSTEEALQLANASPAGLAAYVYGRELGPLLRAAEALQAGMVGVNSVAVSAVAAPFGGVRESGHGREGSRHGIGEYMDIKYVALGGM